MKQEYQVTLTSTTGKYKPVSCIVVMEVAADIDLTASAEQRKILVKKGTEKICIARLWNGSDLKKFGYTKAKVRLYDREKIKAENAARYERIKEKKYNSGEWKRPKGR